MVSRRERSRSLRKYPPVSMQVPGNISTVHPKTTSPEIRPSSSLCNIHVISVPQNPNVDKPTVTHCDAFDLSRGLPQLLQGLQVPSYMHSEFAGATRLFICLIEATDARGLIGLQKQFPSFPKALLSYISTLTAFGRGTALMPEWRSVGEVPASGLSFVDNYVHMTQAAGGSTTEAGARGYTLGSSRIRSMPLAVWTGGKIAEIPIIMVMGKWDIADVMKFIRHCEGDCGGGNRYQRLKECPQWIFHDLCSTFTDWNEIWDAVQMHMEDLDQEVHELLGTSDVLERMRRINKATAANIMLRESLAMQEKSLQVVDRLTKRHWSETPSEVQIQFGERCNEILTSLEYHSVLAKGNLEQLQNLLSMMVSLEQITQGNSVARLNILAFTFLPLSFIASIFGMTQFTISPRWYPAYALPMLVVTIVAAILMPSLVSRWDLWKRSRRLASRSAGPSAERGPSVERGRSLERAETGSVFRHTRRRGSWGSDRWKLTPPQPKSNSK